MALEQNNNVKYDPTGRFYYLTLVGAEKETGYALGTMWGTNAENRLKKHGRAVKRYLTMNPYNDSYAPQHRPLDLFEYMVFINANDEAQNIYEMLVEMAEWAYDTGGDRAVYEDGGGARVPDTVKDIAEITGLRMIGKANIFIEDDEWRIGY